MEVALMHLKILLPDKVFADIKNVKRIVVETSAGSYGILPQRLDCVAALESGILVYEMEQQEKKYIAVNEGILVKTKLEVFISVRHAIGDAPLGKLRTLVDDKMMKLDEMEINDRRALAKLETGFMRHFQKLRRGS